MLRCPDPSCSAAVGQDIVELLATDEDKEKYSRYLLRSYVEDNRKIKWCPAPGCEFAVEFVIGSGNYDICCSCSYNFCWNCTEEAHRPVDCVTVAKWILKNSAESENMNWYFVPSRKISTNPNNVFQNLQSRQKALADLHSMQNEKCTCWLLLSILQLEKLSDRQSQPESQLKFIIEAWLQVGFMLETLILSVYFSGEAESGLERLHQCAEKELQIYLDAESPMKDFNDFRTKLAGLT
ncbi:hypothetical protein GW17_00024805, partial [Ensete ventricosum]